MALGGAAGSLLGPRTTFVVSGVLMATISAVLIVRVRRATVTLPSLAEQAVGAP
jgi:hypothetical protein